MGNSDGIADQITGQNDDYSLGIPRANLELKQMSIIDSYKNMLISSFMFSEHYNFAFTPYWQSRNTMLICYGKNQQ